MSNKTQLQTNNTALDGYIARINAAKEVAASLPEAGSGGSGSGSSADIKTCTISGFHSSPVHYTTVENGEIVYKTETLSTYTDKITVLCDSLIFYIGLDDSTVTIEVSGGFELIYVGDSNNCIVIKSPSTDGADGWLKTPPAEGEIPEI